MPLLSLLQFHACEGLEQESIKLRNVESRRINERVMFTADAAYLALIGYGEAQRFGKFVINAIAPRARVYKRANFLLRKVRFVAGC